METWVENTEWSRWLLTVEPTRLKSAVDTGGGVGEQRRVLGTGQGDVRGYESKTETKRRSCQGLHRWRSALRDICRWPLHGREGGQKLLFLIAMNL